MFYNFDSGWTVHDLAEKSGNSSCLEVLRRHRGPTPAIPGDPGGQAAAIGGEEEEEDDDDMAALGGIYLFLRLKY